MNRIKYKKWIKGNLRIPRSNQTRYKKLRLDKNERISPFENFFLKKFISKINSNYFTSYPEISNLYSKIAKKHHLNQNQIVITAGSDAAIKNCFDLFVSPNDSVITLDPTFAMVGVYCKLFNAKQVKIKYNKQLKINTNQFLKKIIKKVSLIIIANPNSPTGTIIPEYNIKKIIEKAKKYNIPVLIDEAYYGFTKISCLNLLNQFNNIIISRTFSKAYGLAGLRIGYMISGKILSKLLYSYKPMYEVNSFAIVAAEILIDNSIIRNNYIKQTSKGKKLLISFLKKNNYEFLNTHTNFIFIKLKENQNKILGKIAKSDILIGSSLSIKGYKKYIRITTGPVKEIKKIISFL